ncbi:MAG: sigma-70 family RNA polymerase sigma factor [Bacteroidetes bacterium]|jgi:RNA polymerase sigma factor (sigma-70 family)|nr:MAG: sigma-70 family RNA polymerase sigma factor [Bacteroidota bacterium]
MTTEQFERVYKKLFEPMVSYCSGKYFGLDFESAVQDAFFVVWKKKEAYEQGKESSIWATLNNVLKTKLRSNKRYHNKLESYKQQAETVVFPVEEETSKADLLKNLSLGEKDQELYNMLYVEGEKSPEIAKILGISVEAVYVRKNRLTKKIKQQLLVDKTQNVN